MITLYHFGPLWGLPDASTFCCKLETYLRMANIPYQTCRLTDMRKAPKGKLPFIDDDGLKIADSNLIIDHLKAKFGDTLDEHLTPLEKARSLAFQCLVEDHLYWTITYTRWLTPEGWEVTQKFFSSLPIFLKPIVPPIIRRKIKNYLHAEGMGRHSTDEVYHLGKKDITALAAQLGEQLFFFGDKPSSFDAVAFGSLTNIINFPLQSPLKAHAMSYPNLVNFCKMMNKTYYKELLS